MTGEDCLVQALMDYCGLNEYNAKAAVKSKAGKNIIQALAASEGILEKVALENMQKREEEVDRKERELEKQKVDFDNWKNRQMKEYREDLRRLKEIDEREEELKDLEEKILSLESPEMRDRLRMFALFQDSVDVQTPQNNSVYIAGMASILAGTSVWEFDPQQLGTEEIPQKKAGRRI